jgi:hypothetical protein
MGLKKELQILRYSIGQYLSNRKDAKFIEVIDAYYKARKEDNQGFINKFDYSYSNFINNISLLLSISPGMEKFKDTHKGESCFIIGNGPSLNKMDLSKLDGYYKFGMNKIYYIFDKVDLKLDYYVAVNPLVIEQSKHEIENVIKCPAFLSQKPSEKYITPKEYVFSVNTSTPWQFQYDTSSGVSEGATVTFVAMQLAFYMGFQNIFLIGVDHNFQQKGKPNEEQRMENEDPNHFDPRYFQGQQWHLADLEASELSYHMAKYAYERAGRKIYDATIDGKLTIFPKIDFEDALKMIDSKV